MTWEQLKVLILNVPNAPVITGTNFVLTFHTLLTSTSRSLYLLSFSVSFVLTFELSGIALSISRQAFSLSSCSALSDQFSSTVRSVITATYHIMVVPLIFMTF